MTKPVYLKDTYLFEFNSSITHQGKDEKGNYILLDQTIFYPQGGGQPSDVGIIKGNDFVAEVTFVKMIENEIRHYITSLDALINCKVTLHIDQDKRLLNSRYHTSAHLLGNVVEVLYPSLKAIKGHSFPGEAYVEFQGNSEIDLSNLEEALNLAIKENHQTKIFAINPISFEKQFYKLPYAIPGNKDFRVMQIGGFLPVPCGGTHLRVTSEIGKIEITKIKAKNDITRISYGVI